MHGLEMNVQKTLSFQDVYHPRLIFFCDVFIDINQKKSPLESLHFRKRDFFLGSVFHFAVFYFVDFCIHEHAFLYAHLNMAVEKHRFLPKKKTFCSLVLENIS